MKASVAPIKLLAVGLLSSAMAAVGMAGYLAWNSLRGQPDRAPIALSQAAVVTPIEPVAPEPVAPEPVAPEPVPVVAVEPAQLPKLPSAPSAPAAHPVTNPQPAPWTDPENNYLFDLSQALQSAEYQRLNSAEQLEIARQIQQWVRSGEDFWSIRQRFDASYGSSLVGNYTHNRDVYIQFATERFAPDYLARLAAPAPASNFEAPYGYAPQPYPDAPPQGYWVPEVSPYAPNWADPRLAPALQPDRQSPIPSAIEAQG